MSAKEPDPFTPAQHAVLAQIKASTTARHSALREAVTETAAQLAGALANFETSPIQFTLLRREKAQLAASQAKAKLEEYEASLARREESAWKAKTVEFIDTAVDADFNRYLASLEPEIAECVRLEAALRVQIETMRAKGEAQIQAARRADALADELGIERTRGGRGFAICDPHHTPMTELREHLRVAYGLPPQGVSTHVDSIGDWLSL